MATIDFAYTVCDNLETTKEPTNYLINRLIEPVTKSLLGKYFHLVASKW